MSKEEFKYRMFVCHGYVSKQIKETWYTALNVDYVCTVSVKETIQTYYAQIVSGCELFTWIHWQHLSNLLY